MASIYLGLMSGTSMDGVDITAVTFENNKPSILATHTFTYEASLARELTKAVSDYQNLNVATIAQLDAQLGVCYGDLLNRFIKQYELDKKSICAIGSHGQTLFHQPPESEKPGYTLQVGDPFRIAAQTDLTVVADFRRADMAAGGHGAPLVPAFHQYCLSTDNESRIIANLGGIANISLLQGQEIIAGFDTGPANTLMDSWCQKYLNKSCDRDGELARTGKIDTALCEILLADPYFTLPAPKSTGREYFNLSWLERQAGTSLSSLQHNDVLASLCYVSAKSIADACIQSLSTAKCLLVCGGGSHNLALLDMLAELLPFSIETTSQYGIDPDYVEATAFAWLAKCRLENQRANLPQVTGAHKKSLLGIIVQP